MGAARGRRLAATLRALLAPVIAFLCARGAISVWQQFRAHVPAPLAAAALAPTPLPAVEPAVAAAAHSVDPAAPPVAFASARGTVPWQALERSASFVEGNAGPLVVAFIDLDCPYCSQLWRRLRAPLAAGGLRVRWIPVAVADPDSAVRAATLLQADDPVAALAAHQGRAGGLEPDRLVIRSTEDIAANNALLATLSDGRPATPLLVSRAADGRSQKVVGLPADLPAFLAAAR